MPELAKRYTVVAVELPGLGLSEAPRTSYTGVDISEYLYKFAKRFNLMSRANARVLRAV